MKEELKKEIQGLINNLSLNCDVETFNSSKLNWDLISSSKYLSESFIREFKDDVNWNYINAYQKLSENFIKEFQEKVHWDYVSIYQKLSESFICDFQDKFDWNCICCFQKLSESFIKEFQEKVDWYYISNYQKLSEEFIEEFKDKLLIDREGNTMYWSTKQKEDSIPDVYQKEEDYYIGYKGIRSDRYSNFNFQYKYEVGQTYECHGDCNVDNENSFGLSVWTEEKARDYCDELVIKVKFRAENLCAVVHGGDKIRVSKFIVIS